MNKFIVIGIGIHGEWAAMNTVTLSTTKPKPDYADAERAADMANALYDYNMRNGKRMPWHGMEVKFDEVLTLIHRQEDVKCSENGSEPGKFGALFCSIRS